MRMRLRLRKTNRNRRATFPRAAAAASITLATAVFALAQAGNTPAKTGYAPVNGLSVYYEIHGSGEPLVLLHGGLMSVAMEGDLIAQLSKTRQVIALDLQAHGRTADIDRAITSEAMGDDVAGVMKYLAVLKADVMGYSLGAGTALQLTFRHPEMVRKLVVVSTPFKRDGWYPEIRAAMSQMGPDTAEMMKSSPLYQTYSKVAPRPQDWTVLVTKVSDSLKKDYDWSANVAAIKIPVMLVFGDNDAISPPHAAEFFALLGGGKKDAGWDGSGMSTSRLAILPGATHYNITSSPALVPTVVPFLDAPVAK
jgi:pimeloyl-ACP methyl ester carboxylesterase